MDKYYEMFRGKNRVNETDFFNIPEDVEDSDTEGELDLEEVGCWVRRSQLCVRENPVFLFIKITQSLIY